MGARKVARPAPRVPVRAVSARGQRAPHRREHGRVELRDAIEIKPRLPSTSCWVQQPSCGVLHAPSEPAAPAEPSARRRRRRAARVRLCDERARLRLAVIAPVATRLAHAARAHRRVHARARRAVPPPAHAGRAAVVGAQVELALTERVLARLVRAPRRKVPRRARARRARARRARAAYTARRARAVESAVGHEQEGRAAERGAETEHVDPARQRIAQPIPLGVAQVEHEHLRTRHAVTARAPRRELRARCARRAPCTTPRARPAPLADRGRARARAWSQTTPHTGSACARGIPAGAPSVSSRRAKPAEPANPTATARQARVRTRRQAARRHGPSSSRWGCQARRALAARFRPRQPRRRRALRPRRWCAPAQTTRRARRAHAEARQKNARATQWNSAAHRRSAPQRATRQAARVRPRRRAHRRGRAP